jgi:uncharacterized Zn finger protein (UPF0148 family)
MSTSIVVRLDCPHCQHSFLEAASLVRPNGKAYCPVCAHLFHLDPEIEAMSQLLARAKQARRERRRRRQEIRDLYGPQAAPATIPSPPLQISDILAHLDELLEKMQAKAPPEQRTRRRA